VGGDVLRRVRNVALLIAMVVASGFWAAPAQASNIVTDVGQWCGGFEVWRCGWMNVDFTYNRVRGYGYVLDSGLRQDWDVAVNNIRLQYKPTESSFWNVVATGGDYDGWHSFDDQGLTALAGLREGWYNVAFHWQATSQTGGTASGEAYSQTIFLEPL
jgi:hypothetical protein